MSKSVRGRALAAVSTLGLAACLLPMAERGAAAACVPGGNGISLECEGVSANAATVVNRGSNPAITGDNGNAAVDLAAGSRFTNSGLISVLLDPALLNANPAATGYYRTRLYGVTGGDPGDYAVTNAAGGSIVVSNPGIGRLWGVAENGDATRFSVNNEGLISVVRGPIALGAVQATALTARVGALPNAALDVAAGIYSEEEAEEQTIVNSGTIRASGQLAAAIYTRAGDVSLTNSGVIETVTPTTGFAIGAVSDDGSLREIAVANSGTIKGDIVLVNGQAQRYWALSNGLGTGGQGLDNRLTINSQFGELESELLNSGTINGDLFYSNGPHELSNAATGRITGDIDVDQRNTVVAGRTCTLGTPTCFPAGSTVGTAAIGNPSAEEPSRNASAVITGIAGNVATYQLTIWGAKTFELENAGVIAGDVTVRTAFPGTVDGFATPGSRIALERTISTSGAGSSFNAPTFGPGSIAGTLRVSEGATSTIAETTTVTPEIERIVHSGEFFAVSSNLYGTALPTVSSESPLVNWSVGKNASGALVIGANVVDAATIAGIDRNGAAAINGLLRTDGSDEAVARLGGRVQAVDEVDDLVELGEALGPNAEGADTELALTTIETITDALSERFPVFEGGQGDAVEAAGGTSVWFQPFGIWTREDEYDGRTGGVILGAEGSVTDAASLGVALAYAESDTRHTEAFSTDVSTYAAAVYGNYEVEPIVLNASIGIARQDFDTSRSVEIEPFTDFADASHDGTHVFGRIDAAYPVEFGTLTVAPVASLFVAKLWQDGYRESATGGIGLSVEDQDSTSVQSGLGLAVEIPLIQDTSDVSLGFEAKWQHEFGDTSQDIVASFRGGPSFGVSTEVEDRDSAELSAELEYVSESGVAASAEYEVEVGSEGVSSQQAVLRVGYTF